jgi:sodium-dependent dicarboxylate transporter 2/3/5
VSQQAESEMAAAKDAVRVLLVDDEDPFRTALKRQLSVRGYDVLDVSNGEDAIKAVRHEHPEVVVLDQKMPGMDGIQTLKELKKIKPEIQVIMLTGYVSTESARITGKHDVFQYLSKPCDLSDLTASIEAAGQERIYALARHEIPAIERSSLKKWLIGAHNHRPGLILLGLAFFALMVTMPASPELMTILTATKTGQAGEKIAGYSDYRKMKPGQNLSEYYGQKAEQYRTVLTEEGTVSKAPLDAEGAATRAKVMVGLLGMAALFWATGAVPVGITALLVGAVMIVFGVYSPDLVARAYAKDSVVFIFGVLAMAVAISKTGLDRRIGLVLLGTSRSLPRFLFFFAPLLSVTASFLSEHALVAFLAPILLLVYAAAIRSARIEKDRSLLVMMLLLLTFAANVGGPGSPAAGGRNAVMLGILADYGIHPTFGEWVKLGLPFVPVMALVIAGYFFLVFRKRVAIEHLDVAAEVRRESLKIGRMTPDEYKAAGILLLLVLLWTTLSSRFGMGGPVLVCIVLMNLAGILRWRDINGIHWDVVALYAAASAMGSGLASTGAALWLADSFVSVLPDFLKSGTGLCISSSIITGILTNFMSDGATVAAVGPITVPMATLANTSPLTVGLATAFASSFAHMFIIGTPNNAIAYSMAKDTETGEQLLTMKDFLVHGFAIFVLSLAVLWLWVFLGYWRWMGV